MQRDDAPISLTWEGRSFAPLLQALDEQVNQHGLLMPTPRIIARSLLELLKAGKNPTPNELMNYIGRHQPGWIGFNAQKWMAFLPRVISILKSRTPSQVLRIA